MNLKLKYSVLATSLAFAVMLSQPAHAEGMNDVLLEQFNTMSNFTQPGVYESQRRGVISGGSMVARSKIMNTHLVGFVPPSWKAGCGGIDFFAGSFSFINGEQFIQLLRSVAANAAGYAFNLALQNVSPQIYSTLNALQNKIQALNEFGGNSCQLAQGIVNSATPSDWKYKTDVSLESMWDGLSSDWFGTHSESGGKSPEAGMKASNPQKYSEIVTGNIVWRHVKRQNISAWYEATNGQTSDDLSEHIMSLTGTVVMEEIKEDEKKNTTRPKTTLKPILKLADLVEGSAQAPVYKCDKYGENECLSVSRTTTRIDGLGQHIQEVLIGQDSYGGIVAKFSNPNNGVPTATEINVMASLPGSMGSVIRNMAVLSQAAAIEVVREVSMAVSVEMAYRVAEASINAVEIALAGAKKDTERQAVLPVIEQARKDLLNDYIVLKARYGDINGKLLKIEAINRMVEKQPVHVDHNRQVRTTSGVI